MVRDMPKTTPEFVLTEKIVENSTSFKQELIYNGRSGTVLKFLYREISGTTLLYPFTQDVQYDLSEGNVLGFKGARVEVLEASNTKIKYKLVANFPSP
jgi:hypothetical protein